MPDNKSTEQATDTKIQSVARGKQARKETAKIKLEKLKKDSKEKFKKDMIQAQNSSNSAYRVSQSEILMKNFRLEINDINTKIETPTEINEADKFIHEVIQDNQFFNIYFKDSNSESSNWLKEQAIGVEQANEWLNSNNKLQFGDKIKGHKTTDGVNINLKSLRSRISGIKYGIKSENDEKAKIVMKKAILMLMESGKKEPFFCKAKDDNTLRLFYQSARELGISNDKINLINSSSKFEKKPPVAQGDEKTKLKQSCEEEFAKKLQERKEMFAKTQEIDAVKPSQINASL